MTDVAATVVDSDVFGLLYVIPSGGDPRVAGWREFLADRRVVIAFQTRAEVLEGARSAGWGSQRMAKVIDVLGRTPTIHSDNAVIDAFANLTTACRRTGHALHQKVHTGDRWVAACVIAKHLELLAGDQIYRGAPNLVVHS